MKYNGKNLRRVLVDNNSPAVIDQLMSSLDPTLKKDPTAINFFNYEEINVIPGNEISNLIPLTCPAKGSFVGWKVAWITNNFYNERTGKYMDHCVVKLRIPAKAKRSSSSGRKCRCSEAKVLGFYDFDGNRLPDDLDARSMHTFEFKYKVNSTVKPNNGFEENRFIECAPGIHFFMNLQEAVNYLVI